MSFQRLLSIEFSALALNIFYRYRRCFNVSLWIATSSVLYYFYVGVYASTHPSSPLLPLLFVLTARNKRNKEERKRRRRREREWGSFIRGRGGRRWEIIHSKMNRRCSTAACTAVCKGLLESQAMFPGKKAGKYSKKEKTRRLCYY